MNQRPNIVYIHSHDTGRYVQPYGYAVETPNMQRLAEQGVLFRKAFCANPTCSPSRACLLTGQYAHANGMLGLAHRGFSLRDPNEHIVHTLRKAGYRTILAGVQHVAPKGRNIGYDEAPDAPRRGSVAVGTAAAAYLNSAPKEPFFLDAGFADTHRVFPEPDERDDPRYCRPPDPLPDAPETRQDMAAYRAAVRRLDGGVGLVLDALESNGLADNTLVICTTDHGIAFPMMKCHLTDHGIGVMLMMRGPKGSGFEGGRVVDAMVSQIDLFPTICELAGIDAPGWLQGESIMPLMRGEVERVREEVFAEVNFHAAYEPQRCVRTERWKYIRRFDDRQSVVMPNCDEGPSRSYLLEQGWREQPREQEMLYDLVFDPHERNNLAGAARFEPVRREMAGRLERWMTRTDDPILRGPIAPPPGAQFNDPDGRSPKDPPLSAPP